MKTRALVVIALFLACAFAVSPNVVAQVQDPSMSGEVDKDTVHVNEDLLPEKRTWDLIEDPWIDPDDPYVIRLNPDDESLNLWRKRRDLSDRRGRLRRVQPVPGQQRHADRAHGEAPGPGVPGWHRDERAGHGPRVCPSTGHGRVE